MSIDWEEGLRRAMTREVTPQRAAQRRAGEAVRKLIERIVATAATEEVLTETAERLEALAAELADKPVSTGFLGFSESATAGDPYAFFDRSPILGKANPLAPPLTLEPEGSEVRGHARFGAAYEGAPGCVHGGYLAAAFDEVLGMVQAVSGQPGMTGTLTVRYRKPTPLHADLAFEGRLDRVEGRKMFTSGTVSVDGTLTAEAEAIFISVDFQKIAEIYRRNQG